MKIFCQSSIIIIRKKVTYSVPNAKPLAFCYRNASEKSKV